MTEHLHPIFSLKADGAAVDTGRVLSIEITDEAGLESDVVTIVLDDADPQIARPREGAKIEVALGYQSTGLVPFGTYVFEEIEREGWPRRLTLICKAADHGGGLKQVKSRSWTDATLGRVIEDVARDNSLTASVAPALSALRVPYLAQTEESDQNLLTRLAARFGAVIAPKDGRLVATDRHSGKTAGGKEMPLVEITGGVIQYTTRVKPRSRYGEIKGRWRDRSAGVTREVSVKAAQKGPSSTLKEVFQSEAECRRAVEGRAADVLSGEAEVAITIVGNPRVRAEGPIRITGVSLDADGDWIAKGVTHRWDYQGGGATTEINCERGKSGD